MATAASTAVVGSLLSVATTTALTAGFTAIGTYLASKVFEKLEEKVKFAVKELTKIKSNNLGTILYRGAKGGEAYQTFMPRLNGRDNNGLSFFSSYDILFNALKDINKYGLYITSDILINQTGIFNCVNNIDRHYNVTLKTGNTIGSTKVHANLLLNISLFIPGVK